MVSTDLKNLKDIEMFKSEIIKWELTQCKCILFLLHLQILG